MMICLRLTLSLAVAAVSLAGLTALAAPPKSVIPSDAEIFTDENVVGVSPDQALRSLGFDAIASGDEGPLQTNDEISRGPSAFVYPKAAPSVVLVQSGNGHGTGFVVDAEGWVLTNHHVIDGAAIDIDSGRRMARVYLGRLNGPLMQIEKEPILAFVHYSDPEKDLALLKLARIPEGETLTPLSLAEAPPVPGGDCVAIGHPTRGALWTVRSGEVAGIGMWPDESVDAVASAIRLAGTAKESFEKSLSAAPKRKVVLSTCGINPGDSGGPLLNDKGELIAVTYAIPKGGDGISFDKFSYHVHVDEVKEFLSKRPEQSQVFVPDQWPPSQVSAFNDRDSNGRWDSWNFAVIKQVPEGEPKQYENTGVAFDFDEDSPPDFKEQYQADNSKNELYDFELAIHALPQVRTFYDTDNDGRVDLILTDANRDDVSDLSIRLIGDVWTFVKMENQRMLDPELFQDEALRKRFEVIVVPQKPAVPQTPPTASN
jgi:S1-C subfamily serine protease